MSYYLLYDPKAINFMYSILTSGGSYTTWRTSITKALSSNFTALTHHSTFDVQAFLDTTTYQLIDTYDQLPTIESHPELFL